MRTLLLSFITPSRDYVISRPFSGLCWLISFLASSKPSFGFHLFTSSDIFWRLWLRWHPWICPQCKLHKCIRIRLHLLLFYREFSLIGLLLIAIGTGGIKPCVAAFGGDQFKLPEQERQLQTFFSVFYFSINAGSLISTFITPIFR